MKSIIPIVHCFDNNFVIPAAVSFYSMLERANRSYFYCLYVLHDDITIDNQVKLREIVDSFPDCSVEFINTKGLFEEFIRKWRRINKVHGFTKEALYGIVLPDFFPQYDKVILTDVDVVFLRDISEEFEKFDIEKGGVDEFNYYAGEGRYLETYLTDFNNDIMPECTRRKKYQILCGYIFVNLKRIRQDSMVEKMMTYATENIKSLDTLDETIINECCFPNLKILPADTLVSSAMFMDTYIKGKTYDEVKLVLAMRDSPLQIHFSTKLLKPWNNLLSPKTELWFEYLKKTSFYEGYMKNLQTAIDTYDSLVPIIHLKLPGRKRFFSLFITKLIAVRVTKMLKS